ncbi:protein MICRORCHIDIA 6-like isoform X3 [Actinidia eriantha]|uniref:protein MICRORCHIDIA 6-like isoform X3 n=1 Tax=Actinidia eriantha TaxID=165200 RepID=UPI002587FC28|nr:protein MICRORCHIDIA 6-like isoform X3 [Actinidia eriantha]
MSSTNIVDLRSDDELGEADMKAFKLELVLDRAPMQQKEYQKANLTRHQKSNTNSKRQESEENRSLNCSSTRQSNPSILDQLLSPIDDTSLSSASPICSAPVCRQFWKAGNYDEGLASKFTLQNGSSYLHIHPKFLHSNATSHKWAFGAIAELLDNAVDEIQNGATFVIVDKTSNPRDGNPALLIQDDGGGMDLEAMRRCLSFGFSNKKSKSAIGQYGNGFKTSSMRLGADVIVFSRHFKERKLTQSIGLLSYTFLSQTDHDRIVVPMLDYEFNASAGTMEASDQCNKERFTSNLSVLLKWSPYSTEAELLKQFDDIGYHGTKVIIYNLWLNDEGTMELDFDSDPEDIRISGYVKPTGKIIASDQHLANRLRYSLRVYLSILYLRIPESFCMILRGRVVEYHNIATDLKFPEFILYKPQSGGCVEGTVVTTIGFVKEAPHVNIHGFNVYHKNRLILPFWHAVSLSDSRGRGVVVFFLIWSGVLEANFIEPTHNKQDFEKTSVFQKLEHRLKEMTWEYWDYHCGLIGYHVRKKIRAPTASPLSDDGRTLDSIRPPVALNKSPLGADTTIERRFGQAFSNIQRRAQLGEQLKRKEQHHLAEPENIKRRAGGVNLTDTAPNQEKQQLEDQEAINLLQENKRLREQCLEYEKEKEELNLKVTILKREIEDTEREYARMMAELELLDRVKEENKLQ